MEDNKIHELVDRKQNETYDRLENTIRAFTGFIAIENQGIKKSIDALTGTVKIQNSSVQELKLWKAGIEGGDKEHDVIERKNLSGWQKIGIISGIVVGVSFIVTPWILFFINNS